MIASTNRPFDLDEAVLRRLPRRIIVDLPDLVTRKEILSVTLANNRISTEVDLQQLAEQLEGYTGSDIKEVCREAVVKVSHERAHAIEIGRSGKLDPQDTTTNTFNEVDPFDVNIPLRPVTMKDFQIAMKKLKASINDNGRELQKVVEWNEKYGEYKRSRKKSSSTLNLYV